MSEELIATSEGGNHIDLPLHPDGPQGARCIDIIDRGQIKEYNSYQGKEEMVHKVTLRFFCGEYADVDGVKYSLWIDKWFRLSMGEKAALRKFIGDWRGKPITDEEAKRFNVAAVLNQPALLQVTYNVKPDKTYVNIGSIMRLPAAMVAPDAPADYVRIKDRPPREERANHGSNLPRGNSKMDQLAHQNRKDQRAPAAATMRTPFDTDDSEDPLPF